MSSLSISSERVISECEDVSVQHPLFGKVDRAGWSKLKSGKEMCFEVTSALVLTMRHRVFVPFADKSKFHCDVTDSAYTNAFLSTCFEVTSAGYT